MFNLIRAALRIAGRRIDNTDAAALAEAFKTFTPTISPRHRARLIADADLIAAGIRRNGGTR